MGQIKPIHGVWWLKPKKERTEKKRKEKKYCKNNQLVKQIK